MDEATSISWDTLSEMDGEFWRGWRERQREPRGSWRWGVMERRIVERESDGRCFEVDLRIVTGDNGPGYERDQRIPLGREVRLVERTVIAWEPVTAATAAEEA